MIPVISKKQYFQFFSKMELLLFILLATLALVALQLLICCFFIWYYCFYRDTGKTQTSNLQVDFEIRV